METFDRKKQCEMHKNMFDRTNYAIENGFYLEAVFIEYAAIEGRLEVMLGILGAPCNRLLPDAERRKFNISQRVKCAKRLFGDNEVVFEKSKLDKKYFNKLEKWVKNRNQYVHGLYKNEIEYKQRVSDRKLAETGLELCKLLYNELNRLKRLSKNHPELFEKLIVCDNLCIS